MHTENSGNTVTFWADLKQSVTGWAIKLWVFTALFWVIVFAVPKGSGLFAFLIFILLIVIYGVLTYPFMALGADPILAGILLPCAIVIGVAGVFIFGRQKPRPVLVATAVATLISLAGLFALSISVLDAVAGIKK